MKRNILNALLFVSLALITAYTLKHIDSIAEVFISLQIRMYGLSAKHPDVFARAAVTEAGCSDNNITCIINAINSWVYRSVKYNYTNLHAHFFGFNDILRYGGVCHHKVMASLIMLHSLGIDNCKVQTKITINDGVNVGHEWFECKINETHKLVCDPTNNEKCVLNIYIH